MFEGPYSALRATLSDHIVRITLSRPELLNRVDTQTHHELLQVFRELESPSDARVVVLDADGPVFSAGGDLPAVLESNSDIGKRRHAIEEGKRLLEAFLNIRIPVVAAVSGPAVGVGATIVFACDAVVSHPTCTFSDPHVRVGAVAGDGSCLVWPQAAGMMRAKRYLLTGDPITGQQAYDFGLITDLVDEPSGVVPAALALAERMAALPPLAVQGTKSSLNSVLRHRFEEVVPLSLMQEEMSLASDDLREAVAAFLEKRPGIYRGR